MKTQKPRGRERSNIAKIITLIIIVCLSNSASAIWIDSVDVIPEQPLEIDIITFDIAGRAGATPSWVEYEQFTQNGASLQLDLYVDTGPFQAISNWSYSKQIGTLNANTYRLEVNAIPCGYTIPADTYIVDFTVVPEPATFVLCGLGLLIIRQISRRKRQGLNV
jgi:hypothetical protein